MDIEIEEEGETSLDEVSPNLRDEEVEVKAERPLPPVLVQKPVLPPTENEEARGHVTRLMIKKIRLHNFKSYAGTKEIGPFHHRFSAIVGPNGSGKSNLIDALLFVFGYRTKKLRLNKLSELIHNSNHGSDLPSASVEILFQQVIDTVRSHFFTLCGANELPELRA
jgi:structural maintenance of chromosome 4